LAKKSEPKQAKLKVDFTKQSMTITNSISREAKEKRKLSDEKLLTIDTKA
jgi:hypothetical protein